MSGVVNVLVADERHHARKSLIGGTIAETEAERSELLFTLQSDASHGTVNLGPAGIFIYTPIAISVVPTCLLCVQRRRRVISTSVPSRSQ